MHVFFCICSIAIPEGDHHPKGRKKEGAMSVGILVILQTIVPRRRRAPRTRRASPRRTRKAKQ
jgi:hypothetical protein